MLEIALATYNGAAYLPAFLESLNRQTVQDWTLTCRDDGSTDNSREILAAYCRQRSNTQVLSDSLGNIGVVENFGALLGKASADYVMLADQDDVWHPEKIERSLDGIKRVESASGSVARPALAFCDLAVVDADLVCIHPSFVDHQGLRDLTDAKYGKLLAQNVAPGCTMITNRALLDIALPIPAAACMHDWWLILVAALHGAVGFIDEPLIDYRQHGNNAVGANALNSAFGWVALQRASAGYSSRLASAQKQATELIDRYGSAMTANDLLLTRTFADLQRMTPIKRRAAAYRVGLRKSGFVRNLAFYLFM